jgi:DNA-binding response OmpR family regulator
MKYNNNIKVIIIEDEQDLLNLYIEFLLTKGYFINFTDTKATNILKEYEKHKPDIIILDHNLEGEKNGIEASKDVLNNFPHASILVISALSSSEQTFYNERVFKGKRIGLLIKPVKLQILEKHIKLLLNNQ